MKANIFLFECLPNEIIIELFKYFSTRDLLQAFYNVNSRFNCLIQNATHLCYSTIQNDSYVTSYPYIHTLIINSKTDDKLNCLSNVRRIILDYVTDDLISLIHSQGMPNLEYLSISHKAHPFYMFDLRRIVFSNTFQNLKYCYISRMKPPSAALEWTKSLSLRVLKVNDIDAITYLAILSACPNLSFLQFKLTTLLKIESRAVVNKNLKRLIINMIYDDWPWNDRILEDYLLCVPNLEHFRICRSISDSTNIMDYFQHYDWLLTIITKHLSLLYRFRFDLRVPRSNRLNECNFQDMSQHLKEKFKGVYQGRYESRLFVF